MYLRWLPVAMLLLAGCSAPPEAVQENEAAPSLPPTVVTLTDPAGDVSGTEAPEQVDLVGIQITSAESLSISMDIARLDGTDPPGQRQARVVDYGICFEVAGGPDRCATYQRSLNSGPVAEQANLQVWDGDCNEFGYCGWRIPFTVEEGSPGKVTLLVPWHFMSYGGATKITSVEAWTSAYTYLEDTGHHGAFSVHFPGDMHIHEHPIGVPGPLGWSSDDLASTSVGIEIPATPMPEADAISVNATTGYTRGMDHLASPEIDLVGFDMWHEADLLKVRFRLASLEALPDYDFHLTLDVGVRGGPYWEIGMYQVLNPDHLDDVYAYAGRCITWHCGEYGHAHSTHVPLEIEYGTPGAVTIDVPLSAIHITERSEVDLLRAWSMTSDANLFWGTPGDDFNGDVHMMRETDILWGGDPLWIGPSSD